MDRKKNLDEERTKKKTGRLHAATFEVDSGFYKCFGWKNKQAKNSQPVPENFY